MPINKALPIQLDSRQETLLQQIVRGTTNPYRLVRRAKLILAAASGDYKLLQQPRDVLKAKLAA